MKSDFNTSPLTSSRGFFPKYRLHLRCEGHSEFNLHAVVLSCVTISSCVGIPHCIGMSVYGATRLVWVALLQGAFSQTEKHIHGEKVRHKLATKTKPEEKGGYYPFNGWCTPRCGRRPVFLGNGQNGMMSALGDGVRGRFRLS